jgi:hypothetical protein
MANPETTPVPERPEPRGRLPTTHWTTIVDPAASSSPEGRAAFGRLDERYRPALLAWLRAWGNPPDRCEDPLHGFFEHLLVKESRRRACKAWCSERIRSLRSIPPNCPHSRATLRAGTVGGNTRNILGRCVRPLPWKGGCPGL